MNTFNSQIGQLFIIGFQGRNPSKAFLNFLAEENIGGVILFADNCQSITDLKDTIRQIKHATGTKPFIAIDQEGGRVSRIKGAPAEIHSAMEYVEKYSLEKFTDDYEKSLIYLDALGININLAPVCDIFINEKNDCLKDRCYGTSKETAIPFIVESVQLAKKQNILSCLKHFPGLGDASVDPHKATAVGDFDFNIWSLREKEIFLAGVEAGADLIMTTHMTLPKMNDTLVTGSEEFIQSYLRNELNFDGVVITDDLTMKGCDPLGDYGQRTVTAFLAGHDILLFGQNMDASMEAYEHFHHAVHNNEIPEKRLKTALERVAGLKLKVAQSVFT